MLGGRLESAIAALSPGWALRRARARAHLQVLERARALHARRYEGADRGRRTQGWAAPDSSPDSATRGALHELRARCRDLRRNNPWAASAQADLVSNIVGEGLRLKFTAESSALERRMAQTWADWADCPACDASGRYSFGALQAAAVESMIEGGQALVRRRFRRLEDDLPAPLQLQLLEGDFVDTLKDEGVDRFGNRTVQGKVYDAIGRLRGFWLYRTHPGDLYFSTRSESVFVPASEVLDVYRTDRPGQVRGIPWGAPIVLRMHDLDAYEDNERLRMVVATSFSAFVQDMTPDASFTAGVGPIGDAPIVNEKGQVSDELEPGTIEFLPPGKTITFPTVPQNQGFTGYAQHELRAIAKGFGTTYEALTGDYSGFNFSSGRMSHLTAHRNYARWRSHLVVAHLAEPAVRWWLGALQIAGELSDRDRAALRWTWIPPRREMIDPRTEVEALVAECRAGFRSVTEVVESHGKDAELVLEQLAKDLERARALGLSLSVDGRTEDPGRIGTVNAGNESAGGDPEASSELPESADELEEDAEEGADRLRRALATDAALAALHGRNGAATP